MSGGHRRRQAFDFRRRTETCRAARSELRDGDAESEIEENERRQCYNVVTVLVLVLGGRRAR